jgi:hypothetical protein
VYNLVKMIDKTNGYVYGSFIPGNDSIMTLMESSATTWQFDKFAAVQERYIANDDDDDDDEADHDDNDDIEREEGDVDVVAASSQRSQQEEEEAPPPATTSKGKEKS